jgi:protein-disulfide isomerase
MSTKPPAKKPGTKAPAKKPSSGAGASGGDAKRRNVILASIAAVAVVAVAAVLLLSGGGDDGNGGGASGGGSAEVQGVQETNEMLDGIKEEGSALGDPEAPVTMIEFADLQCPFCKQFALSTYPVLVNDYVREGKLRIEFATLAFIGPDSEKGARAAAAAGEQGREAYFTQLWYWNQGTENSGYADDAFIEKIWKAAGVDVAKAKAFTASEASKKPLEAAQAQAEKYGVASTPSFVLGKTGGPYEKIEVDIGSADGFKAAIDELSK